MTTKENYTNKLKKLDPRKAVERGRSHFSERAYLDKLKSYGSKMGTKLVYYSLLLYYALKSPETPKKAKLTIAGALGYLIFPVDVIPDFLPVVGFSDDSAVIVYAIYQVMSHIDQDSKAKAHARMEKLFGEKLDKQNLEIPE